MTCSFDQSKELFADLTQGLSIQLWNVETKKVWTTLTLPIELSADYTCHAWSPVKGSVNNAKKPRMSNTPVSQYLACGTKNGDVIVWDVIQKEVLNRFSAGSGTITSIAFSGINSGVLFLSSRNGAVESWDIHQPKKLSNNIGPFSKVAHKQITGVTTDPQGFQLFTATNVIEVWDMASQQLVKRLKGHLESVSNLQFSSDGKLLISASHDNFINLWNMTKIRARDPSKLLHTTLSLDASPISISVTKAGQSYHVLALTESHSLFIYEINLDKNGDSSASTDAKISLFQISGLKAAAFASQPGKLKVAFEGIYFTFATEKYYDIENQEFVSNLKLEASDLTFNVSDNKTYHTEDTQGTEVLGKASMSLANAHLASLNTDDVSSRSSKTLAELVRELDLRQLEETKASKQPLHAGSLRVALSGSRMLTRCLTVTDDAIIEQTVQQLNTQQAMKLMSKLLGPLESADMSHRYTLLVWIKTILKHHMPQFIAMKENTEILGPLYHILESRLSMFSELVSLSGRLELVSALRPQSFRRTYKPYSRFMAGSDLSQAMVDRDEDNEEDESAEEMNVDDSESAEEEEVEEEGSEDESEEDSESEDDNSEDEETSGNSDDDENDENDIEDEEKVVVLQSADSESDTDNEAYGENDVVSIESGDESESDSDAE